MDGKQPSKITVLLDPEEFSRFEAYCESQGFKKSTLIARLIREYLDTAGFHVDRVPAGRQPARQQRGLRR
jgi:hypothetical protein